MDVPNIDAMSDDELRAFAGLVHLLDTYVQNTIKARRDRLAGYIDSALMFERLADRAFEQLPQESRW